MKSEVIIGTFVQPPALPYLVRHLLSKRIVLVQCVNFDSLIVSGTGVSDSPAHNLGYYSADWNILTEPEAWEVLPAGSKVILTQET